jgi:hypothetical protein
MLTPQAATDQKFENEEAPRILEAVRQARAARAAASVTVSLDVNGGITTIMLEIKKRIK